MATTYTDNFTFPLLGSGSSGWDAVINGMLESVDIEIKAAQSPLVSLLNDQTLISMLNNEIILQHYQL